MRFVDVNSPSDIISLIGILVGIISIIVTALVQTTVMYIKFFRIVFKVLALVAFVFSALLFAHYRSESTFFPLIAIALVLFGGRTIMEKVIGLFSNNVTRFSLQMDIAIFIVCMIFSVSNIVNIGNIIEYVANGVKNLPLKR